MAKFLHSITIMVGNFIDFWCFNYKDKWFFNVKSLCLTFNFRIYHNEYTGIWCNHKL